MKMTLYWVTAESIIAIHYIGKKSIINIAIHLFGSNTNRVTKFMIYSKQIYIYAEFYNKLF